MGLRRILARRPLDDPRDPLSGVDLMSPPPMNTPFCLAGVHNKSPKTSSLWSAPKLSMSGVVSDVTKELVFSAGVWALFGVLNGEATEPSFSVRRWPALPRL